mgnify:FL=1
MRLLFVHDDRVKMDNKGNYYTGGAFNNEVWQRYYNLVDNLTVLLRSENKTYTEEEALKKFNYFDSQLMELIVVEDLFDSIKSFFSPRKKARIKATISEQVRKSDYIIARLPSYNGSLAVKYAQKFNKPYLIELVGCPWDSLWNYGYKGKLLAPLVYFKTKKLVREASYVLYVTERFLQQRYPTKGKFVNCSNVSVTEFSEIVLKKRVSKITNISNKIILGTAAAVDVKYKGQQYIIKALGKLKEKGIVNYEYQLIGDGDTSYLRKVAQKYNVEDQVKFLGSLPHKKVFDWLDSIDIYVQPSRQEGLPRALVEAMSRGLPAFGAKTGGIPELLDSKFIFSNSKKNIDEICEILLLFDKSTMLEQAKRNFNKAKSYDKKIIDERRRAFFQEFIKHFS